MGDHRGAAVHEDAGQAFGPHAAVLQQLAADQRSLRAEALVERRALEGLPVAQAARREGAEYLTVRVEDPGVGVSEGPWLELKRLGHAIVRG